MSENRRLAVLALALSAVLVTGIQLKMDHKANGRIVSDGACYVWTDGHKTCKAVNP